MPASDILRSQLQAARRKKDELSDTIKDLEEQYDSLILFIPEISSARGSVSSAVKNRKELLSDLDPIKKDCDPAASYCKGMNSTLSGVGIGVVLTAILGLSGLAAAKKLQLNSKIQEAELEIKALKATISTLETELAAAETLESAICGSNE